MDVLFAAGELCATVAKRASRVAYFGLNGAAAVELRLQQLWAAPTLAHMRHLPGRCRELSSDPPGQLAIDARSHRLLFRPTLGFTLRRGEQLDWKTVDSITITEIVGYDERGTL